MTKMYVGNCTQQVQHFMYRLPERPQPYQQIIPIGGQILIPLDLSTPDVTAIIQQHDRYGMVRVDEIDRTKAFMGLCYDLDRKIDVDKVRRAHERNQLVLTERGRQLREEAAVFVNNTVEQETPDLKAFEMEVQEVSKKGEDIQVNEKIRVSRTDAPSGPKPSARGRRAA